MVTQVKRQSALVGQDRGFYIVQETHSLEPFMRDQEHNIAGPPLTCVVIISFFRPAAPPHPAAGEGGSQLTESYLPHSQPLLTSSGSRSALI